MAMHLVTMVYTPTKALLITCLIFINIYYVNKTVRPFNVFVCSNSIISLFNIGFVKVVDRGNIGSRF